MGRKKENSLHIRSTVRYLSIKCYAEQMGILQRPHFQNFDEFTENFDSGGKKMTLLEIFRMYEKYVDSYFQDLAEKEKQLTDEQYMNAVQTMVKRVADKQGWFFAGILHKDFARAKVEERYIKTSKVKNEEGKTIDVQTLCKRLISTGLETLLEKRHCHFIIAVDSSTKIETIFNVLQLDFDKILDVKLFDSAVATISKKNLTNAIAYLTHETDKAIKDGKQYYTRDNVITSDRQMYDNYMHDVDYGDYDNLMTLCKQMGYNRQNFDEFYSQLPNAILQKDNKKLLEKCYNIGVRNYYNTNIPGENGILCYPNRTVSRLCIYVEGGQDLGKSYFSDNLPNSAVITDDNTGAFDNIRPWHQVLSVSDTRLKNLLAITGGQVCELYRRNANNNLFFGDTVIISNNRTFEQWLYWCNPSPNIQLSVLRAVTSRFFVCRIVYRPILQKYELVVRSVCSRGSDAPALNVRFFKFKKMYEKSLNDYAEIKKQNAVKISPYKLIDAVTDDSLLAPYCNSDEQNSNSSQLSDEDLQDIYNMLSGAVPI